MGRKSLVSATDDEIMLWMGERLRVARERQGMTSLEAAARAGLSRRTVYRAERGQNPTLHTLVRLLRLHGRLEDLGQVLAEPELSPMALLKAPPRRKPRGLRGA